MRKIKNAILTVICCMGLIMMGCMGVANAQDPVEGTQQREIGPGVPAVVETNEAEEATENLEAAPGMVRIWGPVLGVEDGIVRIDNQSGVSSAGEIVLNIDPEYSRVLDGENGFPVELENIKAGDFIYAYIGPAMTLSLPPMTTAEMVICQVPQDMQAPDYVQVKSMGQQEDGSWRLETMDGISYHVPEDCLILPYLTRNIVTFADMTESSTCMVWTDNMGSVSKIVLFPSDFE